MNIVWALLCENVKEDPPGTLTIENEFNTAYCPSFPFRSKFFFYVARVLRAPDDEELVDGRIRIKEPAGEILIEQAVKMPIKDGRVLYKIQDQIFPTPGIYTFELLVDGEIVHTLTLRLLLGKGFQGTR